MAVFSDAHPDVVGRLLATDYCVDCPLSVPEPINPTAAITGRGINLELHMLGTIIRNVPTTWNKELLCCNGISDFGITNDLRPRVIQIVVREMKQSKRSDVESLVQRDESPITFPVARLEPTRHRASLCHESLTVLSKLIEAGSALMLVAQPPSPIEKTQCPAVSTCLPPIKLPVQP